MKQNVVVGLQEWSDWTHEAEFADFIINIRERHRRFLEYMTNTMTIWCDL